MSDRINVIRAPRDSEHTYFAISRALTQDKRLSFEARGVLSYLLSKPSDWVVRVQDLQKEGGCGRDRIYRILNELKDCGYLHRDQEHQPNGTFVWGPYRVYEQPFTDKADMVAQHQEAAQPFTGKPYTDKPDTVKPYTENTHIYKEESSTDQRVIQKRERGAKTPAHTPAVQAYFDAYPSERLNADQIDQINTTVTALPKWQEVLRYWKASNYRAQSIPKMLDRYLSGASVADDRPGNNRRQEVTRAAADLPLITASPNRQPTPEERRAIAQRRQAILEESRSAGK